MECWNNGILGFHSTSLNNITLYEINTIMERKNINRGFKELRVWQDAVSLYVLACKIFSDFPFELKKVAANSIDAVHSISRNISEGYCRRGLKEYLNYLNFALGSCGEFHSCYVSFKSRHGGIKSQKRTMSNRTNSTTRWKMNCLSWLNLFKKSKGIRAGKIPSNPDHHYAPGRSPYPFP